MGEVGPGEQNDRHHDEDVDDAEHYEGVVHEITYLSPEPNSRDGRLGGMSMRRRQ